LPEPIGIGGRGTSSCGSLGGLTCGGVKFFFCCATFPALPFFRSCCVMSSGAEAKVPGIMISALILSSSAALAQNTNYQGTTSKPGASFQKDDSTVAPTSAKKKHHSKRMKSNAQTTGSGNSSNPTAATTKVDVTPKSR
jgi:hypothetical protein